MKGICKNCKLPQSVRMAGWKGVLLLTRSGTARALEEVYPHWLVQGSRTAHSRKGQGSFMIPGWLSSNFSSL